MNRPKIRKGVVDEIMFLNDHSCCICQDGNKDKDLEIHHIDYNNQNNNISNLAVLCKSCQGRVHRVGLGRKYTIGEVKKYKKSWEYLVKRKRGLDIAKIEVSKTEEKKLWKFYINKTIYEASSIKDVEKNKDIIDEKFETLMIIQIFHGADYSKDILDGLSGLAVWHGIGGNYIPRAIAEFIGEKFFLHLVGPDKVKITRRDVSNFKKAVHILDNVGNFSAEFNKKYRVISTVCLELSNLSLITHWYNLEYMQKIILDTLKEMKDNCLKVHEKNEKKLKSGVRIVNQTLESIRRDIFKDRPAWKKTINLINKYIKA